MAVFLAGCAVLVFAMVAYRAGFRIWAEHPRVAAPRAKGARLTVYEVAALRAWRLHRDRLAVAVVSGMVLSGVLRPDGRGRLEVAPGVWSPDAVQAAVLAALEPGTANLPSELRALAAGLEEVRAVERGLEVAGLVTRSDSDLPVNVSLCVMLGTAVVAQLTLMTTSSLLAFGVFAGLLALGGGVALATPERFDRTSRRGRRLLRAVGTELERRPVLVLDEAAYARLVELVLYSTPVPGFYFDPPPVAGATVAEAGRWPTRSPGRAGRERTGDRRSRAGRTLTPAAGGLCGPEMHQGGSRTAVRRWMLTAVPWTTPSPRSFCPGRVGPATTRGTTVAGRRLRSGPGVRGRGRSVRRRRVAGRGRAGACAPPGGRLGRSGHPGGLTRSLRLLDSLLA
ncbi:hypothetical protein [Kitasatospora sp. NPDC050543]|uniref:hypothetical protein n=1 Tax=Kitasatospora sp. NPDC050543 TaxID=3364054 RepID=UPI00378A86E5